MSVRYLFGVAVVLVVLFNSAPAFSDCDAPQNGEIVSSDLVQTTSQAAEEAQVPAKASPEQLATLGERVKDLNNAAEARQEQARSAQMALLSAGDCGGNKVQSQCIQQKIDQDRSRLQIVTEDEKTKLQDEIAALTLQLNAPKTLNEQSSTFTNAATTLQGMVQNNDFSYKEHLTIIGKALLSSWQQLITPGPVIAISAGMAGYGVAKATSLNQNVIDVMAKHPNPSILNTITDQVGYAYPVLAPFVIIAAITKNNETMTTADELLVGSALSQLFVEPLKYIVREERPNGTDNLGFPSGHSAEAFMMATVLDHRYGHKVGIPAFLLAGLVAYDRSNEGNHTLGELSAGAGIGIATGLAASRGVEDEFAAEAGKKRSVLAHIATGEITIKGHTIQCIPMGLGGSCAIISNK